MQPEFSVIVPAYNAEKYLKRCLSSIICQTYQNFEVIVIDDGSVDSSFEIANSFCIKDSRFKVVKQENSGSQASRANGVKVCNGNYITFVDADDYIDSDYFEIVSKKLAEHYPDVFCVGCIKEFNSKSEVVLNRISTGFYEGDSLKDIVSKVLFYGDNYYEPGILAANWSKFFKRSLAKKIFPQVSAVLKMGEDAVCTYSSIGFSSSIEICNEIYKYHYVNNSESIVNTYDRMYFERFAELKKNFSSLISKGVFSKELARQSPYYYSFLIELGFGQIKGHFKKLFPFSAYRMIKAIRNAMKHVDLSDIEIDKLTLLPEYNKKILFCINKKSLGHLIYVLFFGKI